MVQKLKVLLADPRHNTRGLHSSYIPINIGYIGSFLKKQLSEELDLDFLVDLLLVSSFLSVFLFSVVTLLLPYNRNKFLLYFHQLGLYILP